MQKLHIFISCYVSHVVFTGSGNTHPPRELTGTARDTISISKWNRFTLAAEGVEQSAGTEASRPAHVRQLPALQVTPGVAVSSYWPGKWLNDCLTSLPHITGRGFLNACLRSAYCISCSQEICHIICDKRDIFLSYIFNSFQLFQHHYIARHNMNV